MSDQKEQEETKFDVKCWFDKIESQIKNISSDIKSKYIPKTETTIKQNIFVSLLAAFGAGVISGLFIMLVGYIRGKRK